MRHLVPVLVLLAACGGSEPANEPPARTAAEAAPLADQAPAEVLTGAEKRSALVPSPVETQSALAAAGIDTQLATLVPASRTFRGEADPDRVAVRAGVVLADLLLTVRTSSTEQLLGQLEALRTGMASLGGGKDIDAVLADLADRVRAGALGREELLQELEELSGAAIPELEFQGVQRIVPLIQAGSWLNGANLVARAVQAAGRPEAADGILKQPAVVAYFADYAKQQGGIPNEVAAALEGTLAKLQAIATKEGSLTAEDVETVATVTGQVMELL